MATGRLGVSDLSAGGNGTSVYACPTSTFAVVTVNLCNRNSSASRTVRIAVTTNDPTSSAPANGEYIEYDSTLLPNGVLERTGIVMDAGKRIVAYASGVDVSCVVMGIETSTL